MARALRRSNCLFFAIALYLRRAKRGEWGYIATRRSRWGRFPHFLFMRPNGRLVSYVPIDPRLKSFPPPFFRGRIRWGDSSPTIH